MGHSSYPPAETARHCPTLPKTERNLGRDGLRLPYDYTTLPHLTPTLPYHILPLPYELQDATGCGYPNAPATTTGAGAARLKWRQTTTRLLHDNTSTAGVKWRRPSMRAPPRGPPRPTWKRGAPIHSPKRSRGRLGASYGASEPALTRPQPDGSRAFNQAPATTPR